MNDAVPLTSCIAPSFYKLHHMIRRGGYSSYWLKGGRGSTKSSFVAIQIILGIVDDPDANALALRKVDNTIRRSVFESFLWAIDLLGLNDSFDHTRSPAEITYLPTGQKIFMSGLDDARKLKSLRVKQGYFKFLWFEEAEEFNGIPEIRNVRQSTRRGGEEFVEFVSYNPPNDPAAWVNKESEVEATGRFVHFSNYLDVPRHWLGNQFFIDAEDLKRTDPVAYQHEYMGEAVGRAEQIVFHGKWEIKDFETPSIDRIYQNRFFHGADWGFAQDPTALVRCFIMRENGETNLYIDMEAGGSGIELDELPQIFNKFPDIKRWTVKGDASRPETVSHMKNKGYRCESAPKWSGSIEDGVEYLRSFNNIYIHSRCIRTIEEFTKYSYKVDKNTQEILPVIIDKWNHYIDALRYALAEYIQKKVSILDAI